MEKEIKLELKHVKGYLDHGLKCNYKAGMHYGEDCLVLGADLDGLKLNMPLLWLRYEYVKPILKTIDFLRDDENFELYLDLCEELGVVHCNNMLIALEEENYFAIDVQKYKILEEWMNKNHFDWKHDLIGKGLAVDYQNHLKTKTNN